MTRGRSAAMRPMREAPRGREEWTTAALRAPHVRHALGRDSGGTALSPPSYSWPLGSRSLREAEHCPRTLDSSGLGPVLELRSKYSTQNLQHCPLQCQAEVGSCGARWMHLCCSLQLRSNRKPQPRRRRQITIPPRPFGSGGAQETATRAKPREHTGQRLFAARGRSGRRAQCSRNIAHPPRLPIVPPRFENVTVHGPTRVRRPSPPPVVGTRGFLPERVPPSHRRGSHKFD